MPNRSTVPEVENCYPDLDTFNLITAIKVALEALPAALAGIAALVWNRAAQVVRLSVPTDRVAIGPNPTVTSRVNVDGAISTAYRFSAAPAEVVSADDSIMEGDGLLAGQVWTLPPVAGCIGRDYTLYKGDAGIRTVSLFPNGIETIDGGPPVVLTTQGDYITVKAVGGLMGWKQLAAKIGGLPV